MTPTAQQRRIIKAYVANRGARYRITQAGEVHIYGDMPNSNQSGWWFLAWTPTEAVQQIQPNY